MFARDLTRAQRANFVCVRSRLARIAAENNLSETAFVRCLPGRPHDFVAEHRFGLPARSLYLKAV